MKIRKALLNTQQKKACLLGIDIRQNFISLVGLSYSKSGYQLEVCACEKINELLTSDEIVINTIKTMLKQALFKTKNAAMALSHSVVIFKEIQVNPGLSAEETEGFLQFNLAEFVGDTKDNIIFDYHTTKVSPETDIPTILRLVAVRRERVEKCTKLLQALNLYPRIIDIDMYAMERSIRWQLKNIVNLIGIINIDYGNIFILVIDSEKIVYMHEDFVGQKKLESLSQVVEQVKSKLQLLYSVLAQPLDQVILFGEIALFPGLDKAINSELSVQTSIANPFLGMKLSKNVSPEFVCKMAPIMLISCGLALRVADGC